MLTRKCSTWFAESVRLGQHYFIYPDAQIPMKEPLDDFGARVRAQRLDKGLTQGDLASRLDISRTYLSHIEGGRAQNLSYRLATALAAELGIDTPATDQALDPVSPSLRRYAERENLSEDVVASLAAVQYRGQRPDTDDQWRILHQLIKATLGARGRDDK